MGRPVGLNRSIGAQLRRLGAPPGSVVSKKVARMINVIAARSTLPAPEDRELIIENHQAWARDVPGTNLAIVWTLLRHGQVQIIAVTRAALLA